MVEVGSVYIFRGRYSGGEVLEGEVVEVIEEGKVARVKLTKPAQAIGRKDGEPPPVGEILRVYLPLMKHAPVNGR